MSTSALPVPARAQTVDTDLAAALNHAFHSSFSNLSPPTLATPLPPSVTGSEPTFILAQAAEEAKQQASQNVIAQGVPLMTEEELEQMEVDEQIAEAGMEKLRHKFKAKARELNEIRLRLAHARRKFEEEKKKQKEARKQKLLEEKRKLILQRQRSEEI